MSSITACTGSITGHIVWDWASDCSRFVTCLRNCCASDWQQVWKLVLKTQSVSYVTVKCTWSYNHQFWYITSVWSYALAQPSATKILTFQPLSAKKTQTSARQDTQELGYRKQIARQLHTQYIEGIHRPKYYTVTLKCRLKITQGHWKGNHWIDHTQLTIIGVILRWILSWT